MPACRKLDGEIGILANDTARAKEEARGCIELARQGGAGLA